MSLKKRREIPQGKIASGTTKATTNTLQAQLPVHSLDVATVHVLMNLQD